MLSGNDRFEEHFPSKEKLWSEVQYNLQALERSELPICVCHGDFQQTNIIYDESIGNSYDS